MFQIDDKLQQQLGIWQWGCISTDELVFSPEVRAICEGNGCRAYGTNWACPPAYGSVEDCRERLMQYRQAWVFTAKYDLEDSFDIEGMAEAGKQFKVMANEMRSVANEMTHGRCMVLANGGCNRCEQCTYPDAPCRFPNELLESLEGYGLLVNRLAQAAHVNYINGVNTVTYFGAVFCDPEET